MPTEDDWEALFATEGYHAFFSIRTDWQEWQDNIRNAFMIVFDPAQQTIIPEVAFTNR